MPCQRPTYVCCRCAHTGKWHFNKVGSWAVGIPVDVDGDMDDPSARKYRLGDALCRLCSEKDETSWMPAQCLGFDGNSCDGNSFELKTHPQTGRPIRYGAGKGTFLCETCAKAFYWCPHGRKRSTCKECGGSGICEHGRRRSQCKECGGSSICEHGRERRRCKACWASQVCEHGRVRSVCEECRGGCVCEHGRRRSKCKECKASQICEHGRQRDTCKACKGSRTGPGEAVRRKGMLRWPGDVAKDWNRCLQGYTRETCCACAPREFPRFFSKD